MKRLLLTIAIITTCISSKSENLISIDEIILKKPNAMSDATEVEYFLSRCTALSLAVNNRFTNELHLAEPSRRSSLENTISRTLGASEFFFTHGSNMASLNGNSLEFFEKRTGSLLLIYNDKLSKGILLHNDMLKYVMDDFEWCGNLMKSAINRKK